MEKTKYHIILDTNAIYSNHSDAIACSKFTQIVNDFKPHFNIKFLIPEIVLKERAYQIQKRSSELYDKCSSSHNKLQKLYSLKDLPDYDFKKLSTLIVQEWAKRHSIKTLDIPTNLSLEEIIEHSINRKGVFEEFREKTYVGEKGFRDFIIIKTIESQAPFAPNTILISEDSLIKQHFESEEKIQILPTLNELYTLLSSQRDHITQTNLKEILSSLKDKLLEDEQLRLVSKKTFQQEKDFFNNFNPNKFSPISGFYWKFIEMIPELTSIDYLEKAKDNLFTFEVSWLFSLHYKITESPNEGFKKLFTSEMYILPSTLSIGESRVFPVEIKAHIEVVAKNKQDLQIVEIYNISVMPTTHIE